MPSTTRTPVTIVVPVWNAVDTTKDCLTCLQPTLGPGDQVVVVDNGSQDATPELLAGQSWVDVVTHEQNLGFAAGCNAGAAKARNPIVIFLNNDTLPTAGWIEGVVAPFTDPTIGATGPMSNFVSGVQLWDDPTYQPRHIAEVARHAAELRSRAAGRTSETSRLVGFCLAVRTSAFAEIGGFDPDFAIGGCEDDDLCHRLQFAGWRLVVAEDTFVHHIGHLTFDRNGVDWMAAQNENMEKLNAKLGATPVVSFVVDCGRDPVALVGTLVSIQERMGAVPFDAVLLVADRAPIAEVLDGVDGVTVVDVAGLTEDQAWLLGQHAGRGLRRALLRGGEEVDLALLQTLIDTHPFAAPPTRVGRSGGLLTPPAPERTPTGPVTVDAAPAAGDPRTLYLDLMQACLLNTIYEDPAQDPWSAPTFDADKRRGGLDWPSQAHTMIGELRMANLRHVVETVIAEDVPGDLIETGVWRGGACIYMRAILHAHGETGRRVFVADSFEGLPPPDAERYPADAGDIHHTFDPLAISLEQVQANFAKYGLLDRQVVFLKGWFKDTLPVAPIEQLAVLRLDGDMYESTMDALQALYDKTVPGGFIIVDDFALPGCQQAIVDFRAARGITDPFVQIDQMSVYWRKS